MSLLTITVPESLHNQLQRLADKEGISIDQLATSALSEKIAALLHLDYLQKRSQQGSRNAFEQALSKVSSQVPDSQDQF